MKKYTDATYSGNYGELLVMYQDYFDLLEKLEEYERKAEQYESKSMSDEDMNYYINTMLRIEMKLLQALQ